MWFKNMMLYRLPAPWAMTAAELEEKIAPQAFAPCSSVDLQRTGWVVPAPHANLVHAVGGQFLLRLQTEKKLLPASVVNQFVKAKIAAIEEQQGYKPGRKQTKEIKEQMVDELLPRAFSLLSGVSVWIDPVNGWLALDTASQAKAEEVMSLLIRAVPHLPAAPVQTATAPMAAMTGWLAEDVAPAGFTIDQDTELRSSGDSKATVRYSNHSIEADEVKKHITGGKRCTRLALTWKDRISFVLTENLVVKRIAPLEVLDEEAKGRDGGAEEAFDADVTLMTGEFAALLADLVDALGGHKSEAKAA